MKNKETWEERLKSFKIEARNPNNKWQEKIANKIYQSTILPKLIPHIRQEKIRDLEEIIDWLEKEKMTIINIDTEEEKEITHPFMNKIIKHLQAKKEELLSNKD